MRFYMIDYFSNFLVEGEGFEDVFEFVGVLVYFGIVELGYYYLYICECLSSSEQLIWIEFNDDVVMVWNLVNLEYVCFGGLDYLVQYQFNGVQYDK